MKLLYLSNNRLPTEKAHGLQIAQMCEALAGAGYDVTLAAPRRVNTPEMRAVDSLWEHYGVAQVFAFRRVPCVDLFAISARFHIAFLVQTFTYMLALLLWPAFWRADVIYTRDVFVGGLVALVRPRTPLVFEVHQLHRSGPGRRLLSFVARRAHVVAITGFLAKAMHELGARRVLTAHDGFRAARFADVPEKAQARFALGIPADAWVIGYVGRLHTMNMPKGLDTLVDALAEATRAGAAPHLLVVGGPDDGIAAVRVQWSALGLPPERLHITGQVPPEAVPEMLAALDVGAMPLPWTEHFAYYASSLKFFEYLASGCAVIASDLPSTAEVVRDGETALLVPPGDVHAWAAAIRRLHDDPALNAQLGQAGQALSAYYRWDARAARIRAFVEEVN